MKTIITPLMLGGVLAALLLATGCQSVTATHTQDIGAPQSAKVDPTHVQILRTAPTRAHDRLGQVRVETDSPGVEVTKIEQALRKEAAKMGADAVVVVYDKTQVTGAQVVGGFLNREIEETQGRVIIGVAIKYK